MKISVIIIDLLKSFNYFSKVCERKYYAEKY